MRLAGPACLYLSTGLNLKGRIAMKKLFGLVLLVAGLFLLPWLIGIPMMIHGNRLLQEE
jgi:hypothetical protein